MCGQMSAMMNGTSMSGSTFSGFVLSVIGFIGRLFSEVLFLLTSGPVLSLIATLGVLVVIALLARILLRSVAQGRNGTSGDDA
jgi:hypothetical protein